MNFIVVFPKVNTSETDTISNRSEIKIKKHYFEKLCSAKADKFSKGLENEKTLKYSYFRYIGFHNKDNFSMNSYQSLIDQIKKVVALQMKKKDS